MAPVDAVVDDPVPEDDPVPVPAAEDPAAEDPAAVDVPDDVGGTVPGVAVADGVNVATNGVCTGVGNTTGMDSTFSVSVGVPNCTVVDPVASTFWTVPAESSPAQTVEPLVAESTSTQQVPVPVKVIW